MVEMTKACISGSKLCRIVEMFHMVCGGTVARQLLPVLPGFVVVSQQQQRNVLTGLQS